MSNLYIYYLTDKCNFRCTYCYEEQGKTRKNTRVTRENIIHFIDKTVEESKDQEQLLYVLFGGEPFLEFDHMKFFTEYATKRRQEVCGNSNVRFTTFTNGAFFWKDENFLKFLHLDAVKSRNFTVLVSYDGVGNYKRLDIHGKDTTDRTLKVMKKFGELCKRGFVDFCISYTVCKDNFNKLYQDLDNILSSFTVNKIMLQFNTDELAKEFNITVQNRDGGDIKKSVEKFVFDHNRDIPKLYNKYHIPICEYACSECKRCVNPHSEYVYGYKEDVRSLDAKESHNKSQILIQEF